MRRKPDPVRARCGNAPAPLATKSSVSSGLVAKPECQSSEARNAGSLIVNADDWGRDHETTERIVECVLRGSVSSVSAMVFMEDSKRAAEMGQELGIDTALHLNLTTPFSAPGCSTRLIEHQQRLSSYLRRRRLARVVFHPGLVGSFEYVVAAQIDEFRSLYGAEPTRLDGHHHMHLCSNVLLGGLLPPGTLVRRNFSFEAGEKSLSNRLYRRVVDRVLARRHRVVDYFFSLVPLDPAARLEKILSLAREFTVEVETHPVNPEEHRFLTEGEIFRRAGISPITARFAVSRPWSTESRGQQ